MIGQLPTGESRLRLHPTPWTPNARCHGGGGLQRPGSKGPKRSRKSQKIKEKRKRQPLSPSLPGLFPRNESSEGKGRTLAP
jgi:hypothetical protein